MILRVVNLLLYPHGLRLLASAFYVITQPGVILRQKSRQRLTTVTSPNKWSLSIVPCAHTKEVLIAAWERAEKKEKKERYAQQGGIVRACLRKILLQTNQRIGDAWSCFVSKNLTLTSLHERRLLLFWQRTWLKWIHWPNVFVSDVVWRFSCSWNLGVN